LLMEAASIRPFTQSPPRQTLACHLDPHASTDHSIQKRLQNSL